MVARRRLTAVVQLRSTFHRVNASNSPKTDDSQLYCMATRRCMTTNALNSAQVADAP